MELVTMTSRQKMEMVLIMAMRLNIRSGLLQMMKLIIPSGLTVTMGLIKATNSWANSPAESFTVAVTPHSTEAPAGLGYFHNYFFSLLKIRKGKRQMRHKKQSCDSDSKTK